MPQEPQGALDDSVAPDRDSTLSVLRGTIVPPAGAESPQRWRLRLESADGRIEERAFHAGERSFELPVAPGTWTIRAEATSAASPSALRTIAAGTPIEPVELRLAPVGVLEVAIESAEGARLGDVPLVLESRAEERATAARTDALGNAELRGLLDGAYRLHVGDREHPIVPPIELDFRGPFQRLEPLRMPPLAQLFVRVVDSNGAPVEGAKVSGSGREGGHVECTTGPDGVCRSTLLPQGLYRVFARHATLGRGDRAIEIAAGAKVETEVRLRR